MGRRIRWLGVAMMLCFALVLVQLGNVQFRQATALANSPHNPRNKVLRFDNRRGEILASDGTVLAQSVPSDNPKGNYQYNRIYPAGSLFAQIVGYDSLNYGTNGVEYQYNSYLQLHSQPVKTIGQFFSPLPPEPDNVTLTVVPALQQAAEQALANVAGPNKDGAVVVLDPHTGAVLAMYSSPSYDPSGLASLSATTESLARLAYNQPDAEGFSPSAPIATQQRFPPGSTSKVVTSSAVYDLKPSLDNFSAPVQGCLTLPESNKILCNDGTDPDNSTACGQTMSIMLPESCDPGYADLGLQLGGTLLAQQAAMFGYNSVPPIDLPFVVPSAFPTAAQLASNDLGPPGVAYSAIGQQDVDATALQNALVASGIANGGVVMVPHVMAQVRNYQGALVDSFQPTVWMRATTQQTAATVTALMESVVTDGTATGCVSTALDAAVKTGTAQTGLPSSPTDDWMIGFAPANNPRVAVAVVVPFQPQSDTGALVAGPIMNAMLSAATGIPATAGIDCHAR